MECTPVINLSGLILVIICEVILTHAVTLRVINNDAKPTEVKTLARIHVVAEDDKDIAISNDFDASKIEREEIEFKPLPFPVDFRFYDVNQNGEISLQELIEITGRAENVNRAFSASDLNGDGKVTLEEYSQIPWGYKQHDYVYQS